MTTLRSLAQLLALMGLLAIRPALADAAAVTVPPFERLQLANGAVVLLMERHDVPLIAFSAVLRGGALSDPADAPGTSSLLASLLEKGAGDRDAASFAQAIAAVGGTISTLADTESITINGSFLARDQALMVELLADMLQRPRLEIAQFEAMRARQIEFIRAAKDSNLSALTPIYGAARLSGDHPYGRPVSGNEASLERISHTELMRYYPAQIGADRLILAIAGDFDAAQMKARVSAALTDWRKAGAALPPLPEPQLPPRRTVLLVDAPESVQSYFWAGALGVARRDPRRAALDVVNTLFGGRFTSMLNTELRVRTGLSYGASSRFDRLASSGDWALSSFTRTETTSEAIDLALSTLDTLHQDRAIDAMMLDSGKRYVQGQYPLAFETSAQWAYQLANLEFYGFDRSYIDAYPDRLSAVTLNDARRAITDVFPRSQDVVLVVIGNASLIGESLRKYGAVTQMKLSDPAFRAPDASREPDASRKDP